MYRDQSCLIGHKALLAQKVNEVAELTSRLAYFDAAGADTGSSCQLTGEHAARRADLVQQLEAAQRDVRRSVSMKTLMEVDANEILRIVSRNHKHHHSAAGFAKHMVSEGRAYRRDLERFRLKIERKESKMPTSRDLKTLRRMSWRRLRVRIHRSAVAIDMRRASQQEDVVDDDNREQAWKIARTSRCQRKL